MLKRQELAVEKGPTSFRLTSECRRRLREMGDKLGLSDAGVVEVAVRLLEQNLGEVLKLPPEQVRRLLEDKA